MALSEVPMTSNLNGALNADEFTRLLDAYIERSEPDTMSFEAFDEASQQIAHSAVTETIEVTAVVQGDALHFDAAEMTPVIVHDNEVLVGGLRLVFRMRQAEPA